MVCVVCGVKSQCAAWWWSHLVLLVHVDLRLGEHALRKLVVRDERLAELRLRAHLLQRAVGRLDLGYLRLELGLSLHELLLDELERAIHALQLLDDRLRRALLAHVRSQVLDEFCSRDLLPHRRHLRLGRHLFLPWGRRANGRWTLRVRHRGRQRGIRCAGLARGVPARARRRSDGRWGGQSGHVTAYM